MSVLVWLTLMVGAVAVVVVLDARATRDAEHTDRARHRRLMDELTRIDHEADG